MSATPLSWDSLSDLPAEIALPRYERQDVTPGIVHFGVGGFHRAHQAMYLDDLMNRGAALDYGIVGVGTQPADRRMRDALTGQDCLYSLVVKHADGRRDVRVIGSIVEYLFAPDDPARVLSRLVQPDTRVVSLTVTEGGYHLNQVTGEFDASDHALQADLTDLSTPRTPFGFIVEGLRRRRAAGTAPFTLVSCDNLQGNGDILRKAVVAFAQMYDADLALWIASQVPFPNSMVDRITPVTTPEDIAALKELGVEDAWPVVCEPFIQWVVEDEFTCGRPELERVGVQFVDDVTPFELMKLRLLNVSHQAVCYLGRLAGYEYAHEVFQDPLFASFALGYMAAEGTPTLSPVPGIDVGLYRTQLLERFSNPHVRDTLERLCAESSDRIPKWLVPVIHVNLQHDRPIERAALVVASWARYAEGTDEAGAWINVVDRRRDEVMKAAAAHGTDPLAFIRNVDLFGDLAANERFAAEYAWALSSLHTAGARNTVAALMSRSDPDVIRDQDARAVRGGRNGSRHAHG
ncbi:mannitol dehydrogenase family protein [Oryzobacter telluris]|uniref:mannitol dehydrogenase family protein n=1 Tax=Oryzobacter telluris TaxID=3149179 RepID=UPI00370DBBAA